MKSYETAGTSESCWEWWYFCGQNCTVQWSKLELQKWIFGEKHSCKFFAHHFLKRHMMFCFHHFQPADLVGQCMFWIPRVNPKFSLLLSPQTLALYLDIIWSSLWLSDIDITHGPNFNTSACVYTIHVLKSKYKRCHPSTFSRKRIKVQYIWYSTCFQEGLKCLVNESKGLGAHQNATCERSNIILFQQPSCVRIIFRKTSLIHVQHWWTC